MRKLLTISYRAIQIILNLCLSQFGFRPHLSTFRAVSNTLQFICNNFDNGSVVVSIFLDFTKELDCVDHQILLKNLSKYWIKETASNWFRSYLSARKQFVSLNGHNSQLYQNKSGFPQGSLLGPLLFLIFINELPKYSNFLILPILQMTVLQRVASVSCLLRILLFLIINI